MPIRNVEPTYLWKQFDAIRATPRPSKHEEKIRDYLLSFAKERSLEALADAAGNVVIRVPATAGHENAPGVVMQAHMDMVCEKNKDVDFDFMNDPIRLKMDGEWLKADGTTLGADNGIGIAAALAIADDPDAVHGPVEILVTVDEETGLTGAAELDPSTIRGRTLLNLDTEELDAIYIGCAGGGDSTLTLPLETVPVPADVVGVRLKVKGLLGGHSGLDIADARGNAIRSLARILWNARGKHEFCLSSFDGGGVHNAIPREAVADCWVTSDAGAFVSFVNERGADVAAEMVKRDPGFELELGKPESPAGNALSATTRDALLGLLLAIPHGVEAMSPDVPGLVETSNNLASVWTREGEIVVATSSRSSVGSALQFVRDRIRAAGELAGAAVSENIAYPGWQPNLTSQVLDVTRRTYERVFGHEPELKAVHAGLECGIIGEKFPGMDMVSIGPDIVAPHSPDERVKVPSVAKFYDLLKAVLAELA